MYEDQCLVCAWLCSGLEIRASMDCATSHHQLGLPTRRAQYACTCTWRRDRKTLDVVRPALKPLHDCLKQVEKYDSRVCCEEQMGDEEERDDSMCLVSPHYAHATADVPQTVFARCVASPPNMSRDSPGHSVHSVDSVPYYVTTPIFFSLFPFLYSIYYYYNMQ